MEHLAEHEILVADDIDLDQGLDIDGDGFGGYLGSEGVQVGVLAKPEHIDKPEVNATKREDVGLDAEDINLANRVKLTLPIDTMSRDLVSVEGEVPKKLLSCNLAILKDLGPKELKHNAENMKFFLVSIIERMDSDS